MPLNPLLAAACEGVSEIVKYGLIRDAALFDWLEANMGKILARDPAAVAHAVEQSCVNKVGAVLVGCVQVVVPACVLLCCWGVCCAGQEGRPNRGSTGIRVQGLGFRASPFGYGFLSWLRCSGALSAQHNLHTRPLLLCMFLCTQAEVVAADEKEGGVRATLNLGHTFGHAIETATGYGTFLHGEAVSIGMVMAADMSVRLVSGSVSVLGRLLWQGRRVLWRGRRVLWRGRRLLWRGRRSLWRGRRVLWRGRG